MVIEPELAEEARSSVRVRQVNRARESGCVGACCFPQRGALAGDGELQAELTDRGRRGAVTARHEVGTFDDGCHRLIQRGRSRLDVACHRIQPLRDHGAHTVEVALGALEGVDEGPQVEQRAEGVLHGAADR